ncbi:hypothetical protein [Neisseria polysaccharea]|uniref:hypothetical protein n=1 Tax=Neisseria polysaccharea TaxID=489 RepID=UPI00272AB9BA|nr:hypothetical protein [Neisseria polysaccharea]
MPFSFLVETSPFGAVESDFVWEGRNPFRIGAAHRATLYVPPCVPKHMFRRVFRGFCRAGAVCFAGRASAHQSNQIH